jgi:hypothetical protein
MEFLSDVDRKKEFLVAYKEFRKRKPALKKVHMHLKTFHGYMKLDFEFANEVKLLEEFLDSTVRCNKCKFVGPVEKFIYLNKTLTRSGRCKKCHSDRQTWMLRNNLSYRLVKIAHDAKLRDPSANNITSKILKTIFEKQKGLCFYTNLPMSFQGKDGMSKVINCDFSSLVSIDRVDSSQGYSIDNVVLCCFSVNLMKGSLSHQTFVEMCKRVVNHASIC